MSDFRKQLEEELIKRKSMCKEKIFYVVAGLVFVVSAIHNQGKEWFDFFVIAFAVYSFFNPMLCDESSDIKS